MKLASTSITFKTLACRTYVHVCSKGGGLRHTHRDDVKGIIGYRLVWILSRLHRVYYKSRGEIACSWWQFWITTANVLYSQWDSPRGTPGWVVCGNKCFLGSKYLCPSTFFPDSLPQRSTRYYRSTLSTFCEYVLKIPTDYVLACCEYALKTATDYVLEG